MRLARAWRRLEPAPRPEGAWLNAALARADETALRRVAVVRTVMFTVIWLWLLGNYGAFVALENVGVFLAFIAVGLAGYAIVRGRPERYGVVYVIIVLDVALLSYTLLTPGRTYPDGWPWQTVLRQPSFLYFLLILALSSLSFRPMLVLWTGLCIAVAWTLGTVTIVGAGALTGMADLGPGRDDAAFLGRYLDPSYVHLDDAAVRVFVTLIITGILAISVWRARRLIFEQAEVARERANLSRYVAGGMVDELARSDRPFGAVRSHEVVVLFADIRGFTSLAERLPPEAAMDLLRAFHGHMTGIVFRHGGTLDKFIGDGLMATFGTPEARPDDARRAVACALEMLGTLDGWNEARVAAGAPPIQIGIGAHGGVVIQGDIGTSRRLEFAVIGDAVNVASRLERLTRERGCSLALSGSLIRKAIDEGADLPNLVCLGVERLRGRAEPIEVWGLPADPEAMADPRESVAGAGVA